MIVSSGLPTWPSRTSPPVTSFAEPSAQLTKAKFKVEPGRRVQRHDPGRAGSSRSIRPTRRRTAARSPSPSRRVRSSSPSPISARSAPLSEVQSQLEALGLDVIVNRSLGGKNGRVLSIDPASGTLVHPGDTVTLTVI